MLVKNIIYTMVYKKRTKAYFVRLIYKFKVNLVAHHSKKATVLHILCVTPEDILAGNIFFGYNSFHQ